MPAKIIPVSSVVYRDDLYPLLYSDIFPDVCPDDMKNSSAGHVDCGVFYPAGSVAFHFFQKQRNHDKLSTDSLCVYFIREADGGAVKIGISSSVSKRLCELQTGNPRKLEVVHVIPGGLKKERELHNKFRNHRLEGEWFEWCNMIEDFINE